MKTKLWYAENYGEKVIELARDFYETDFCKVLFAEDCKYEDDCPASEDDLKRCISKAYRKQASMKKI